MRSVSQVQFSQKLQNFFQNPCKIDRKNPSFSLIQIGAQF